MPHTPPGNVFMPVFTIDYDYDDDFILLDGAFLHASYNYISEQSFDHIFHSVLHILWYEECLYDKCVVKLSLKNVYMINVLSNFLCILSDNHIDHS